MWKPVWSVFMYVSDNDGGVTIIDTKIQFDNYSGFVIWLNNGEGVNKSEGCRYTAIYTYTYKTI